jgi:hypothetical protein
MLNLLLAVILLFPEASIRFSSPKIYTVPPGALNLWLSSFQSYPHQRTESEFSFTGTSLAEDIIMIAPVNLAHGGSVRKLTAYLTDNTDQDEARMLVILGRQNLQTGDKEQMASVSTNQCSASPDRREFSASTINFAKINNDQYSYHLLVIFGRENPNLKFHAAKIYY